jgi:D-galactarolactone cycloisomerase
MKPTNRERPAAPALARVEAHVLRWPVRVPVRTSFGTMHDRPALLVRIEDAEGAVGWGEAWCNFPACGAEHRARLIETVLAPLLVGRAFASPQEAFRTLSAATAVLAIQSGEPGPIAQTIAGVDIALHDLAARRAGLPLWRALARSDGRRNDASAAQRSGSAAAALGDDPAPALMRLRVYASGINPEGVEATLDSLRRAGHTAFKLKVGFGAERDLANLAAMRGAAGAGATLMLDANQAWSLDEAIAMAGGLADAAPAWLEEPLRADRPPAEWQRLAATSPIPLAAGENAIGDDAFDALIASRAIAVVQPDLAKWGGVSGVLPLIDRIGAAGLRYCPHYLGAGIGLLASAHVLAARDLGAGLLEIDANENPLRNALCPPLATLAAGGIELGAAPGLGVEPDLAALAAIVARRGS